MLTKPNSCGGCPLAADGQGFMEPQLNPGGYGVLLLGEALGADEAEAGRPFVGRSGFRLTRLIEWAGLDRAQFSITNSVYCRPADNRLEGTPYEIPAISHCRAAHWDHLLGQHHVVVPLGNVPTNALLGRKGILGMRGYVYGGSGYHIVPTLHPAFIARGQSKYSAAVINDLQKAVHLAQYGLPAIVNHFSLDPSPREALEWARGVVSGDLIRAYDIDPTRPMIAFDIETPYKALDEGEVNDDDDPTYQILRISFAFGPRHAMSIPWSGEYIPAVRVLLDNPIPKTAWNMGFDMPRIRANGVPIGGVVHDGMVAWHILHSDLPKGLGFVATFTSPWQSEWKSLSSARPAYYSAVDSAVTWEAYHVIERELHRAGMWDVYERDVLQIDPILAHMHEKGMPIDLERRADAALKLAHEQVRIQTEIDRVVPLEAKQVSPRAGYVRAPKDVTGLIEIQVPADVTRCSLCGTLSPTRNHFRVYKKPTAKRPQNPCAAGTPVTQVETITRLAAVEPFKPSGKQLGQYQRVMGRVIPTRKDRKTGETKAVFDEMAINKLAKQYPSDSLYRLLLDYRGIQKLASVYIGCVEGING